MKDQAMSNDRQVGLELHHEIEQFLYAEARLLDGSDLRAWLTDMVDPEIRYQVVSYEERMRRDRRPKDGAILYINDDNFMVLDMRVKQFGSGMQTMLDPLQRMRRVVSNVTAFHGDSDGEFHVLSYVTASRFRRLYEHEQLVYGREDVLRRDGEGKLRVASRRAEIDERVPRNKNILFFL